MNPADFAIRLSPAIEGKLTALLDQTAALLHLAEYGVWAFVAACASVAIYNLLLRKR